MHSYVYSLQIEALFTAYLGWLGDGRILLALHVDNMQQPLNDFAKRLPQ